MLFTFLNDTVLALTVLIEFYLQKTFSQVNSNEAERGITDVEAPARELGVALEQLGEPEAERRRLPRDLLPHLRHARVVHRVHSLAQTRRHDDRPLDGQFQVAQHRSHLLRLLIQFSFIFIWR